MAIKTDAMIAHNGADGYTLHIDYDPDTDEFSLNAIFNDGTVKNLNGNIDDEMLSSSIIDKSITYLSTPVTTIGAYSLRRCMRLVSVEAPNATVLDASCLFSCTALKNVYIPSVTTIASYAFTQCSGLEEIYLPAGATSISATAFTECPNLTVINCGFSSTDPGAASAPWGATNATVNYDVPAPNPPVGLSLAPNPGLIQNIDLEPIEEIQPVDPEPVVEVKKTKRSAK